MISGFFLWCGQFGCVNVFCFIGFDKVLSIKRKPIVLNSAIKMDLYSQSMWLSQVLRPQFNSAAGSESNAEHSVELGSQSRNTNDEYLNRSNETSNVYTSANIDSNAVNGCRQTIDYIQLMKQFNQNNQHFLAALLEKGSSPTAALASASQHRQQTVALIPPTPPRTPITLSAAQQQVSSHAKPDHF